jgi:hypothetical protein
MTLEARVRETLMTRSAVQLPMALPYPHAQPAEPVVCQTKQATSAADVA